MKQIISIVIILLALFNLSCYCIQGELTKRMIEKSDIIFEGRIVKIKSEIDTNDSKKHYVTFNISRLIKGNSHKKITLVNQITSCSFLSERYLRKYIGLKFIAYFSKEGNYYSYRTCKNRIIFEKPIKRSRTDSTYYEKLDEYKREYKEEITKLDSLINSE
jgi:hypothetical protein